MLTRTVHRPLFSRCRLPVPFFRAIFGLLCFALILKPYILPDPIIFAISYLLPFSAPKLPIFEAIDPIFNVLFGNNFIVGYQIDDNTVSGFNFVTPTFRPIGWQNGDTVSIQEIQMDATVADGNAFLYRLDETRKSKVDYQWLSKATCTAKGIASGENGSWVIKTQSGKVVTYSLPTEEEAFISPGEGVQVRITTTGKTFNYNGGVSDLQMSVPAVAGFNFVGNPYPADASIQDIQMDATVADGNAFIYRLDSTRKATVDYQWLSKATCTAKGIAVADGYNGAWVIKTQSGKVVSYSLPTGDDAVLRAGEVLQVRVTTAGKTIYVNPTYEL